MGGGEKNRGWYDWQGCGVVAVVGVEVEEGIVIGIGVGVDHVAGVGV